MKKILTSALLAMFIATGNAALSAETKPSAAAAKTNPSLAGEYSGKWRGENETSGALTLKFSQGTDSAWTMEASFTFEGSNVPTTTKSVRFEGNKLETEFAWDVQGTAASSKLTGVLTGDRLEGTYDSTTSEGAGKGKWNVTRVAARS